MKTPPSIQSTGKQKKWSYHLLAFVVMSVWGSTFASSKTLILHGMAEPYIFFFRFIAAYFLLLAVSHKKLFSDNWKDEAILFLMGIAGGSFYFMAENYGLHYTQTTDVAFIIAFTPLLTTLVAYCFHQERQQITLNFIIGLVVALIGIAFLIFKGDFHVVPSVTGDFLAFLAALFWSFYSILSKFLGGRYSILFVTRKVFFYGWLTILPVLPAFSATKNFSLLQDPVVGANLFFLAVVASFLGFICWNLVMEKLGVLKSSYYLYINPVASAIMSILFMNETMNISIAIGLVLILSGVIYSEKK